MSTTRRAPKRKRVQRRIENEQLRTARRDSLAVLLSRAQRGVLSRDEAALLRAHVEAEIREGDAARQSERGQQRATDRERRRVEAAEQAITELERDLADAEAALAALSARDGVAAVAVDYRNQTRRYRAAWQSAATRARAERAHREQAEHSAKGWQDTARQYASNADYWRERAERAEAALEAAATAPIPYQLTEQAERVVVTDREAIRNALDDPEPRPAPRHIGHGANAEDCPACDGTNPPYPFICPGPADQ